MSGRADNPDDNARQEIPNMILSKCGLRHPAGGLRSDIDPAASGDD
jgi:hypothetical protein